MTSKNQIEKTVLSWFPRLKEDGLTSKTAATDISHKNKRSFVILDAKGVEVISLNHATPNRARYHPLREEGKFLPAIHKKSVTVMPEDA